MAQKTETAATRDPLTDTPVAPSAPEAPPKIVRTEAPQAAERPAVSIGRIVHVTDAETGKVHPAIVTHANDDQSVVATIFKPNETVAGVGFAQALGNLAQRGHWHWPM